MYKSTFHLLLISIKFVLIDWTWQERNSAILLAKCNAVQAKEWKLILTAAAQLCVLSDIIL